MVWQAFHLGKGKDNFMFSAVPCFSYTFTICIVSLQTIVFFCFCTSYQGREEEDNEKDVKNLNVTAQKLQPKNEGTIINALSDMNQSYESRKQQNSRSFVPFTGITESR